MGTGSDRGFDCVHQATPVSGHDVARVVSRALAERPSRIRLTPGQRLAILNRRMRPGWPGPEPRLARARATAPFAGPGEAPCAGPSEAPEAQ